MTASSKRILLWSVLVVLVAAGLAAAFAPRPVPVDLVTVARGPLVVTVEEEGKTRIHDVFVLSAPVAGRVTKSVNSGSNSATRSWSDAPSGTKPTSVS